MADRALIPRFLSLIFKETQKGNKGYRKNSLPGDRKAINSEHCQSIDLAEPALPLGEGAQH